MQARPLRDSGPRNGRNEMRKILKPSMSKFLHASFCGWVRVFCKFAIERRIDRLSLASKGVPRWPCGLQLTASSLTQADCLGFERRVNFLRNIGFFLFVRHENLFLSLKLPGFSSIPSKPEREWIAIFLGKSKIPKIIGTVKNRS